MQQQLVPGVARSADEEFLGPFSTWTNVQTTYGATGDGTTDDTVAIQTGLDALGTGSVFVLYFPAGTYKITTRLTLHARLNVAIIGAHPATTTLAWHGPGGISMFNMNGTRYSRFSRLTFDGRGLAQTGVYQGWTPGVGNFDSGNSYTDMVFTGMLYGIYGGGEGFGFAEVTIQRCTFMGLKHGITLGNFNALDVWIWDSLFDGNQYGITNIFGAGGFRVYTSVFRNSTVADMAMLETQLFSARGNFSSGSAKFFDAGSSGNPAQIVLQGNTVITPDVTEMVSLRNQGPNMVYDNVFRSAEGASTGPVVRTTLSNSDVITVGNTYTVSSPLTAAGRALALDDTTVTYASLSGLTEPALPPTPTTQGRTIVEVTVGSSTATIQAAIDTAAAGAAHTVVHLQPGGYSITAPLVLPAHATLQFIGDGIGRSTLQWSGGGAGPMLLVHGPTQAVIKDITFNGNGSHDAIVVDTIDQVGSRVALRQVHFASHYTAGLVIGPLIQTVVDLRDIGLKSISPVTPVALDVVGAQHVLIHSGASSTNAWTYRVREGGRLLVRDVWYETTSQPGWLQLQDTSGTVTVENNRVATVANSSPPAIVIDDFVGRTTLLTSKIDDRVVVSGVGTGMQVLVLGLQGPLTTVLDPWFSDTSLPAADARRLYSRHSTATGGSAADSHIGAADAPFLRDMLVHARAVLPGAIDALGAGVTDLRLTRVEILNALTGMQLLAGSPTTPSVLRLVR